MARPIVLSNGQMFVGLDENALVHDFYYPYVGLENLTNARSLQHKIGVWVDGIFSWVDDGTWDVDIDYEADALISSIRFVSSNLNLTIHFQDYIDTNSNALIRHVTIVNPSDKEREIRVFMHQVFRLSNAGRGDTAIYVPDENYILDYKGRTCLLISGKFESGEGFDQFATGIYAIEGKAGTYLDAMDGELSGNSVEHGGVDSVIRFKKIIQPNTTASFDYWILADNNQRDLERKNRKFMNSDMTEVMRHNRQYWQNWINKTNKQIPANNKLSVLHSLLIIKAHCDYRGSILASGDSSIFNYGRDYYCYCWPRDAAYALWPLMRLGHIDEAKKFIDFARDTIHPDGYLLHKYQPDRAIGSTWHPLIHSQRKELAIQEDETAITLFLINELYESTQDTKIIEEFYSSLIEPAANFIASFIDRETGLPHASYDLWEEKFLTSTYTVCTVIAGLRSASRLAKAINRFDDSLKWSKTADSIKSNLHLLYHPDGYFRKGLLVNTDGSILYDDVVDISSLYGAFMYSELDINDPMIINTAKKVEETILNTSPSGGVLRYENDQYFLEKQQYKGNPWVVSTLWLAQYYVYSKQTINAQDLLDWALGKQLKSGVLSEQFDPENGIPKGVAPLVWSQAELINTILDINS